MKKILLIIILAFPLKNIYSQSIEKLDNKTNSIINLKIGALFNFSDYGMNYIASYEIAPWKNFSFETSISWGYFINNEREFMYDQTIDQIFTTNQISFTSLGLNSIYYPINSNHKLGIGIGISYNIRKYNIENEKLIENKLPTDGFAPNLLVKYNYSINENYLIGVEWNFIGFDDGPEFYMISISRKL